MMFTEEEVATNPVRIIGKVVELRGKLKKNAYYTHISLDFYTHSAYNIIIRR